MGLITGLLTLPLAPVRGTGWLAEKILEQAEAEAGDETSIHAELLHLQELHEAGEIDADELAAAEDALFERLLAAQQATAVQRDG
jgi:Gas vesicle protein G